MKTTQKVSDAYFFSILGILFALLCHYIIYNRYDSSITLLFFSISLVLAWMGSNFEEKRPDTVKKLAAIQSFTNRTIIVTLALVYDFSLILPTLILGIILFTLVTVNRSINGTTSSIFIGGKYSKRTYFIDSLALLLWLISIVTNYEIAGYLTSSIFGVLSLYTLLVTAIIRFIYYFVEYLDLDEIASANI